MELLKENCVNPINELLIGKAGLGAVKVGGQTCMPFLFQEGVMPNAPIVAAEILDCEPADWPEDLVKSSGYRVKDPVVWAKDVLSETHAKMLCVRLQSAHPDWLNRTSGEAAAVLEKIASAVNVPLVVIGCGDDEKDNDLMPKVSMALKGYNALIGMASQNNYKTITATCLADGHSLITESPIDVNIAKQLNILVTDMGFDPSRIAMHPTTASLGYGMEYAYSIMERSRLAAFMGDKMLAMPFILFIGPETWRTKESKDGGEAGGVNWEIATAVSMLQAGADILVMRHPEAVKTTMKFIELSMRKG